MLNTLKKVSLVLVLAGISQFAVAGGVTNTLEVDSEVGRGGLPVREDNPDEIKSMRGL